MKSYSFLFWAYNVIWFGLAAYFVWLVLRVRGMTRRIEGVERELERRDG